MTGAPGQGPRITLIGKPGCHLCDEARQVVARVTADNHERVWRIGARRIRGTRSSLTECRP